MGLRSLNGLMGLLAFTGLLATSIVLIAEGSRNETTIYKVLISICTLLYTSSFFCEYFSLRRVIRELDELTQSIKNMEEQTGISLEQSDGTYYITAISDILSQSLTSLDEKT